MSKHPPSTSTASKPARLALSLDDAGSSGIITIHDLRAEPLPLSLSCSLSHAPSPPPPRPHPSPPTRPWSIALGAATALCVGMLGLLVALGPTAEAVTEHPDRARAQLSMHEAAAARGELTATPERLAAPTATRARAAGEASPSDEAPAEVTSEDLDANVPVEADAAAEPEPEPRATKSRSRSRASSTKASASRSPEPKATADSNAKDGSIPVECVLDPARCDASGSAAKTKSTGEGSRPAPLAAKLSTSQLKQALATTKADARRCGPEHGVDPGTTVRVKLSIEGATGSVLSATPLDEHASGSLGRCVARALGQTEFPRFASGRMGTIYSVRL